MYASATEDHSRDFETLLRVSAVPTEKTRALTGVGTLVCCRPKRGGEWSPSLVAEASATGAVAAVLMVRSTEEATNIKTKQQQFTPSRFALSHTETS